MVKKSLALMAILMFCSSFLSTPVFAGKVLLKLQSQFPDNMPVGGESMANFMEMVTKLTDNQVRIKFFNPGKLVPPAGVLEAVSKNQIDAGFCSTAYWAGKLPTAPLFLDVPFGPAVPERVAWMIHGNGNKLWQEMYDQAGYNVHVIPFNLSPAESGGWYAKPVNTVKDLKGLTMRFGGYAGDVMQKLGASVTFMAMGDVFPALEKGALDACEFAYPSIDAFLGFSKVVKYNYYPGWWSQGGITEFLINKDTWENKLTESQRFALETAGQANLLWSMGLGESTQAAVLRDNVERKGVQNMVYSPELMDAFKKAWAEVAAEKSAKDPFFKKVWDDLSAFRADYALWGETGYLPQNCGK